MDIYIAGIEPNSMVNGPGMRYTLFTQGCRHHCRGCQNQHTWEFGIGKKMTVDEIFEDIKSNVGIIRGVTLSGGDPMEQAEPLTYLCKRIHDELGLDIWCYTGYTFEQVKTKYWMYKLLTNIDTLVDDKFDIDDTDGEHQYRGSNNQNIIHVSMGVIVDEQETTDSNH